MKLLLVFAVLSCGTENGLSMAEHRSRPYAADLQHQLYQLQLQVDQQEQLLAGMEAEHRGDVEENRRQNRQIHNLKKAYAATSAMCQKQEYACFSQVVDLWCFDGGVIQVTEAFYGLYASPCTRHEGNCCLPDIADDCRVPVLDNNPSDWLSIKATCDNRTTCSYEYLGSAVDECWPNSLADYLQIYYTCGEEVSTAYDPVGFTAYTDTYHTCDNSVNFEGVITNVGAAYDAVGSSFTCPYRGVYMFSVSVKMTYDTDGDYDNYIVFYRNQTALAHIFGDGDDIQGLAAVSGSLVIECEPGEVIWIGCEDTTIDIYGGSDRESLFSGYMMYRYE